MTARMRLAYVENDGRVAVVEAAQHYRLTGMTGLGAGAKCIQCGNPVALRHYERKRRGSPVEDHFMHPKTSVCVDAVSCDAHQRALRVVEHQIGLGRAMHCPAYGEYVPVKVLAEKSLNEIRPDLILSDASGRLVLVEIFVTHRVPEVKRMLLRSYGIPTVEVDLSKTYGKELSDVTLANAIYDDISLREWIVSGAPTDEIALVGSAQRDRGVKPVIEFLERIGASIRYMVTFPWVSKVVVVDSDEALEPNTRSILLAFAQQDLGLSGGSSSADGGLKSHATKKVGRKRKDRIPPSLLPCLFADVGMALIRDSGPNKITQSLAKAA